MRYILRVFVFLNLKSCLSADRPQVLESRWFKKQMKARQRTGNVSASDKAACSMQNVANKTTHAKTRVWSLNMATKDACVKSWKQWIHLHVTSELGSTEVRGAGSFMCSVYFRAGDADNRTMNTNTSERKCLWRWLRTSCPPIKISRIEDFFSGWQVSHSVMLTARWTIAMLSDMLAFVSEQHKQTITEGIICSCKNKLNRFYGRSRRPEIYTFKNELNK